MNPDDDELIEAELTEREKDQVQAFFAVAQWIADTWPDGRGDRVIAFLDSCVDAIWLPAHPDNSGNRPAVITRMREIAELRLAQIGEKRE